MKSMTFDSTSISMNMKSYIQKENLTLKKPIMVYILLK